MTRRTTLYTTALMAAASPLALLFGGSGMALAQAPTPLPAVQITAPTQSAPRRAVKRRDVAVTARVAARPASGAPTSPPTVFTNRATAVLGNLPAPYAGGQVASGGQVGLLGNRTVMDTPFNQTSFTRQTIQDQQAQSLNDILANDPSVSPLMSRSSPFSATYFRGFLSQTTTNSDYSLNGLYGIVPANSPSLDMIERVEVLRGPSALLNGMPPAGAIGGTVNLITKRAPDVPFAQLTTSYISDSQLGSHIDVGRRFGDRNEFGMRFNGVYRNGDTNTEPQKDERGNASLNLDYRGENVRLSADVGYQENHTRSYKQPLILSLVSTVPLPPDASRSLTPPWAFFDTKSKYAMVQGEVDLAPNVTAYAAIGTQNFDWSRIFSNLILTDTSGNYRAQSAYQRYWTDTVSGQAGVRANVATGAIEHSLSLNASGIRQEEGPGGIGANSVNMTSNIYNPVFGAMPNLIDQSGGARLSTATRLSSVGFADTMSVLNGRVMLTAGVRRQQVAADSFDTTTQIQTAGYSEQAWSPAYALVVKPWKNVSLYANYIEGLQQGTIVGQEYANAGAVFAPYQSKQKEVGVKIDWGRLITVVSAFEIARPSTIEIAGTSLPTLAVDGEQVNKGIEVNAFGELAEGFRVMGGVTLLDGTLTKTQGGRYDGKEAQGTPDFRVVAGSEWDTPFMRGLTLTGRATFSDGQYVSNTSYTLQIPSWHRLDLGLRYAFASPWSSKPVVIRFNVENALGDSYWVTGYAGTAALSDPRTYLLSTTFTF